MKNFTPFILCIFFASSAFAQITITAQDVFPPITPDTAKAVVAANATIILPTTGNNQNWDYSMLAGTVNSNFSLMQADNNPNFPNADGMLNTNLFIGPVQILGIREYYASDAQGYYLQGVQVDQNSYGIGGLTGDAGDTLKVMAGHQNFSTNVRRYELPLTASSSWVNQYEIAVDFEVTVSSVGLANEPGQLKRYFVETYEVVGWGEVDLPQNLGTEEALLLKSNINIIDSLFLGGMPANPLLLAGLGLTQGTVTTLAFEDIFIRGLNRSAIQFETDSSHTTVYNANYCTEPSQFSIFENKTVEAKIFPNPTSDGEIQLVFEKPISTTWEVKMVDLLGKEVFAKTIARSGEIKIKAQLPATAGLYFFQILDESGKQLSAGKVIRK